MTNLPIAPAENRHPFTETVLELRVVVDVDQLDLETQLPGQAEELGVHGVTQAAVAVTEEPQRPLRLRHHSSPSFNASQSGPFWRWMRTATDLPSGRASTNSVNWFELPIAC